MRIASRRSILKSFTIFFFCIVLCPNYIVQSFILTVQLFYYHHFRFLSNVIAFFCYISPTRVYIGAHQALTGAQKHSTQLGVPSHKMRMKQTPNKKEVECN